MNEKKYFWFKMKEDFFQSKEMKKLRRIAGGDTYAIIYLKLILISLKTGGKLYYEGLKENLIDELSIKINENYEHIESAFNYFLGLGLIVYSENGVYFIKEKE